MDKKNCATSAAALANALRKELATLRILGPVEPYVSKIRNLFIMTILLKIPKKGSELPQIKKIIMDNIETLQREKEHRNTRFVVDVDPV